MYFARGRPTLPSREDIRADDSPQTKAPAPVEMDAWKLNPVPMMLLPSRPRSSAWRMAAVRVWTARGYSMRTYRKPRSEPMA